MLRNWSTKDPKFHRFTPSQFLGFNGEHVRCRIPKAKIMALSLKGGHDGCCACETGNPTKNMISASFANISRQLWRVLSWILWGFSPEFREGRGSLLSCFFFGEQTNAWIIPMLLKQFVSICKASLFAEACSFVAEHRFYLRKVVERVEMVSCSLMIPCCKPVENRLKDHENKQCVKVSYFKRCLKQCLQLLLAFGEGSGSWGLLQSHSSFSFTCQRVAWLGVYGFCCQVASNVHSMTFSGYVLRNLVHRATTSCKTLSEIGGSSNTNFERIQVSGTPWFS